jgi:hypothetical protein
LMLGCGLAVITPQAAPTLRCLMYHVPICLKPQWHNGNRALVPFRKGRQDPGGSRTRLLGERVRQGLAPAERMAAVLRPRRPHARPGERVAAASGPADHTLLSIDLLVRTAGTPGLGRDDHRWLSNQTSAFSLSLSYSGCEMTPASSIALAWAIWSAGDADEPATSLM